MHFFSLAVFYCPRRPCSASFSILLPCLHRRHACQIVATAHPSVPMFKWSGINNGIGKEVFYMACRVFFKMLSVTVSFIRALLFSCLALWWHFVVHMSDHLKSEPFLPEAEIHYLLGTMQPPKHGPLARIRLLPTGRRSAPSPPPPPPPSAFKSLNKWESRALDAEF